MRATQHFTQDHACNAAIQLCVANGLMINASEKVTTPHLPILRFATSNLMDHTKTPLIGTQILDFLHSLGATGFQPFQPEWVTGVGYGAWEDMKVFASAVRSALWSQVQGTGTARDG